MDICDYTNSENVVDTDGVGDAAADNREGEITDAELAEVEEAWSTGEVQDCDTDEEVSIEIVDFSPDPLDPDAHFDVVVDISNPFAAEVVGIVGSRGAGVRDLSVPAQSTIEVELFDLQPPGWFGDDPPLSDFSFTVAFNITESPGSTGTVSDTRSAEVMDAPDAPEGTPDMVVESVSEPEGPIVEGDTFRGAVVVRNAGDGAGDVIVSWDEASSVTLTLDPGDERAVESPQYAAETAGEYSASVDILDDSGSTITTETISVDVVEPDDSSVHVDLLDLSAAGQTVTPEFEIRNEIVSGNGESITGDVNIKFDGDVIETISDISLSPGDSRTLSPSFEIQVEQQKDIEVCIEWV